MTNFSTLPAQPLTGSDLHIWRASLNSSREDLSYHLSLLSADEKARAERFYFERDRNRFIIGRGILRTILGGYLGIKASAIAFSYGEHGKPAVEKVIQNKTIQFNLSHSEDQAIYVFGWDRLLGIDLERIRPMQDADDFAMQFFSVRETALINSLSGDQKWNAFFKLWTCKEAFLKANGSGLTFPLNQVEIFSGKENSAALISISGDSAQAADWRLETFNPIPGYQAALAVEGCDEQKFLFYLA